MNWIKSSEREPLNEGKYYCKYNGLKIVLDFVKLKPKKEHFIQNESYNDNFLNEINFWTEDIHSSIVIKSHDNLVWLDEN